MATRVEKLKHEAALFIKEKESYEKGKARYESAKERFYDSAAVLFPDGKNAVTLDYTLSDKLRQMYQITRVTREKLVWDLSKLKRKLSKKALANIIDKRYTIIDVKGLTDYLKSLGASAKTFKRFINVEETVNERALENAIELGRIDSARLDGCYTIEQAEPYYRVSKVER